MPRREIDCSAGLVRVNDKPPTTVASSWTDCTCSSSMVDAVTTLMVCATFCSGSEILFAVTMMTSSSPSRDCDGGAFCAGALVCADTAEAIASAPALSNERTAARTDPTDSSMFNPPLPQLTAGKIATRLQQLSSALQSPMIDFAQLRSAVARAGARLSATAPVQLIAAQTSRSAG